MKTTKRIWVPGYRPFVMGGSVHYVIACDVEVEGPFALGRGIKGYTAEAPNGTKVVVDAVSLGIVGNSLEAVKADVKAAESVAIMRKQQQEAKEHYAKAAAAGDVEVREPGYFWAKLGVLV